MSEVADMMDIAEVLERIQALERTAMSNTEPQFRAIASGLDNLIVSVARRVMRRVSGHDDAYIAEASYEAIMAELDWMRWLLEDKACRLGMQLSRLLADMGFSMDQDPVVTLLMRISVSIASMNTYINGVLDNMVQADREDNELAVTGIYRTRIWHLVEHMHHFMSTTRTCYNDPRIVDAHYRGTYGAAHDLYTTIRTRAVLRRDDQVLTDLYTWSHKLVGDLHLAGDMIYKKGEPS